MCKADKMGTFIKASSDPVDMSPGGIPYINVKNK